MARVNYIQLKYNDVKAQEDYDNLFYELDSDAKEESTQQDFCKPLQHSDFPNQLSNPNSEKLEDMSHLEGTEGPKQPLGTETTQPPDFSFSDATSHKIITFPKPPSSTLTKDLFLIPKILLNWNTQRHLA